MGTKWLLIALPLIVIGVLAQSALWVPSCDNQTKGNPARLQTFLRSELSDAKTLNSVIYVHATAADVVENNISEGLVVADENLNLVGQLADHWQVTEDVYVAALPERTLPDGCPATAVHVALLIEAAWKDAKLGGIESNIQAVEPVAAETRTQVETTLIPVTKGKKTPLDVELSIAVPKRVKIRLSKVESQLFEKLEPISADRLLRAA